MKFHMLMPMNAWMMLVLMKCKCQMQCLTLGCYRMSSPTLCLKCVLLIRQGRDLMHGLCWWETPTEPKLYLFFSSLRHIKQDEVMLCVLFTYVMGDKIKRFSCLTYGRIVHKVLIFT